MKFLPTLLVGLLLLFSAGPADAGPTNWATTSFEPLEGTVAERQLKTVVRGLAQTDSAFVQDLGQGHIWSAIEQVLDVMVEVDQDVFDAESTSSMDTSWTAEGLGESFDVQELREQLLLHSGFDWSFWSAVAELGKLIYEAEFPAVVYGDAERIMKEMEQEFLPLFREYLPVQH